MPTTSALTHQRAENASPYYITSLRTDEPRGDVPASSLQFLVESPHNTSLECLEAGQSPQQALEVRFTKTPEMLQQMFDALRHPTDVPVILLPSALNAYLDCWLKFYYLICVAGEGSR